MYVAHSSSKKIFVFETVAADLAVISNNDKVSPFSYFQISSAVAFLGIPY